MMIDFRYMTIRLFALRVGKKSEDWRVAYGVVSPAIERTDRPIISGSEHIGSCGHGKISARKIIWSGERENVLGVFDDLSRGVGLKSSFSNYGVDTKKLDFDVVYTQVGIEEPWGTENVIGCQKAYTKKISMCNPAQLLEIDGKEPNDVKKALRLIESYLEKQTGLPFNEQYDHVGNLEIIIVPERDESGRPLVRLFWEKGKPYCQHVMVQKEILEKNDELTINLVCTENGRIVIDKIDHIIVEEITNVEKAYTIDECPDRIFIKIWRQRKGETVVLIDTTYCLLKHINVTVGIMEQRMKVTTQWLEDIRKNLPQKNVKDLETIKTFERKGKEHFEIGEKEKQRKKRINREKDNDEFFSKGWDKTTEEQGMLSFMGWFKKKAKNAKRIFLQDPYFEDVAMYFLAMADISSEYTILTQTRLKTNPDGRNSSMDLSEDRQRKETIVNLIKANPILFDPMKLVVKDLPTKHNILHDRYFVFDYGEGQVEAYSLSNSLQGATRKQPLLVTQIGDSAFEKVKTHIAEMLEGNNIETIYDYADKKTAVRSDEEASNAADDGFLRWLDKQKEELKSGHVSHILKDIYTWRTYDRLATLGYFLATINSDEAHQILEHLSVEMKKNADWTYILKDFILRLHYSKYPIGYIGNQYNGWMYGDVSDFLSLTYKDIVTPYNINLIDNIGCERYTFGVYGQYFAAKFLLKQDIKEYVNVLKQLKPTLLSIKTDKTITPCYKVTIMLLTELIEADFWSKNDTVKSTLIVDSDEVFRGLGTLMYLQKARKARFKYEDFQNLIKNDDELITLSHAAWGMKPAAAHPEVFYKILRETFKKMGDVKCFKKLLIEEVLGEKNFIEDKIEYMNNVVCPLINEGFIDKSDLSKTMIDGLYEKSISGKYTVIMSGVLPECMYTFDGELQKLYELAKKEKDIFNSNLSTKVVLDENHVFNAGKRCIHLRLLLKRLIERYEKTSNNTIDDLKKLLVELDKMLDEYGLTEKKKIFDTGIK